MPLRPDPFEFDPQLDDERRGMSERTGYRLASALCVVLAGLALLTVAWPDWIEDGLGFDPDEHSGAAEWGIVGVLVGAAVFFGVVARRQRAALRRA
jgi:hypothetical protein